MTGWGGGLRRVFLENEKRIKNQPAAFGAEAGKGKTRN